MGEALRSLETGDGPRLIHLVDQPRLTRADEILSARFRVTALPAPRGADALDAIVSALDQHGVHDFDLMATAETAALAVRLALQAPERVRALVLESPEAAGAELAPRLSGLTTPTLVVLGTGADAGAQQAGRAYVERVANGHLVFVYDTARAVGDQRPEAFAEVVADFLDRHEAFIISRTSTVIHP